MSLVDMARRTLRRVAQRKEAAALGLAAPCVDWVREREHAPHAWTEDGVAGPVYRCSGFRPLDTGTAQPWDFNWPQPGEPLRPGDVVTAEHLNGLQPSPVRYGRRWA